MKTVYLSKYVDGRPSISKANVIKETELSIKFSDVQDIMGWIWVSNKIATKRDYLKREGVMVSESLQECLEHIRACAEDDMKDLEIQLAQAKKHVKVFGDAVKAKDKKDIAKILGELNK